MQSYVHKMESDIFNSDGFVPIALDITGNRELQKSVLMTDKDVSDLSGRCIRPFIESFIDQLHEIAKTKK